MLVHHIQRNCNSSWSKDSLRSTNYKPLSPSIVTLDSPPLLKDIHIQIHSPSLEQPTILKIILNYNICDCVKHKLNVVGVRGARQVRVNLLLIFPLVQVLEFHSDITWSLFVRVASWKQVKLTLKSLPKHLSLIPLITCILWEADSEWRSCDFLLKQILFVQKQNYGRLHEPLAVADGIEQLHWLDHSVHLLVLSQHQIVTYEL